MWSYIWRFGCKRHEFFLLPKVQMFKVYTNLYSLAKSMMTLFPWLSKFTNVPFEYVCVLRSRAQKLFYIYIYTGCPRRNVPDFGRMFLKLKYTDLTKNTYIRSWMVKEIIAREKCGLFAVPRTVPGSHDVLPVHCACPSFSLQPAQAHSRCDCTCKVLGTLRTTAT